MNPFFRRGTAYPAFLVALAMAAQAAVATELVRENFGGAAASGLTGVEPATNRLSPGTAWVADPIIAANGSVTDGSNTDRGAWLDLGAGFAFLPNQTYTLELGWTGLSNSVLYAGFMKDAPNASVQMQTQSTNFALRARLITAGDPLAATKYPVFSATLGTTVTPAQGTASLTLATRDLSNATFSVNGLTSPVAIDLTGGFRYLWIGYEDPDSGESNADFDSLTFSGPLPVLPPLPEPIGTPNILMIVGSGVAYGDLQCNGGVDIATPAIDSLAYDGIRFTQFTTTGPGKTANQYALFTGRVAARSGLGVSVPAAASGWQAEEWTLAEVLRKKGYSTAFIGEWNLGNSAGSHPNDQGFQLFHGFPYNHALNPPLEENRQLLEAAPDSSEVLVNLVTRTKTFIQGATEPFALVFQPPELPAEGMSLAGAYGKRIEALDQATAHLLAELQSSGKAANTLVIFIGDGGTPVSGENRSNGIFRDGADTTWEGGMRFPLIARLPGTLTAGQNNLSLVWLPDLMPTIASLVGGSLAGDRPLDGTSRHTAFTGASTRPSGDEKAFGFRHDGNAYRLTTVRQGKWKSHMSIINNDPLNTNPTTGAQLYDLHIDADERINRASQQASVLAQLASLANGFSSALPAPGATDLPAPKPAVIGEPTSSTESSGETLTARFNFTRPVDSLNDDYSVQHSDDLSSWVTLPITPYVKSLFPLAGNLENLDIHVPLGARPFDGNQRFVRLSFSRNSNP